MVEVPINFLLGAPIKSTTSCFLTEACFCLGKHRVSSRGGFESPTVAPVGDIKLASATFARRVGTIQPIAVVR
jgi:hypothetical protein